MLTSNFVKVPLACVFVFLLASWAYPPEHKNSFSYDCDLYVENNLASGSEDVYFDSDIDAVNVGTLNPTGTFGGMIYWNTAAVTIDVYIPTIPRNGGAIDIYHGLSGTLVQTIPLQQGVHYYTWIDNSPPSASCIVVKTHN